MQTITQHIKLVKNFKIQSNENVFKLHQLLSVIKEKQFWKTKKYYKGQNIFNYEK